MHRIHLCSTFGALLCLLFAGNLSAQSLTWDANGDTTNVIDGGGTWNTTNYNWWDGSDNVQWDNAANNIAIFGNNTVVGTDEATSTVTVSGTVNAGGLRFARIAGTYSYRLTGGTIALTDGAVIQVDDNTTSTSTAGRLTISSSLSGNDISFTKSGGGTSYTTLSGNNTWTGTLTLTSGGGGSFLNIGNVNSVNTLSSIDVQSGNTLVLGYSTGVLNTALSLAGTGIGNRGAIRFDRVYTLDSDITLTANTGISVNNNTITGTIAGDIGESGGSRTLSINTSSITDGATTGATIVLSGNNTFTGGVNLTRGTLRIGSTGALNSANPNLLSFTNSAEPKSVVLNGFSVAVSGLSTSGTLGSVTVQNISATSATLTISGSATNTFSGVLANGTGAGTLSLLKTGTGTQILTGASTYTGTTTVAAGTLNLDFSGTGAPAANILGSGTSLVMSGGTLTLTGGSTTANSQTVNGLTVAAGQSTISLITNATAQDLLLNLGTITAQAGGTFNFLLPTGTQTVTNGIRTTSSNDASGILGTWATVNGTEFATVNANGNIVAYDDYDLVTVHSAGAGAVGPIPNDATANIKIIDGGQTGNINLAVATGTTDINTLLKTATEAATINIGTGQTLRLGVDGIIRLAQGAGNLTIGSSSGKLTAGGTGTDTPGRLVFNDFASTQNTTVNATIVNNGSGAISVVKNGPGSLNLANGSTYSGGIVINGGTVIIGADSALGAVPSAVDADNLTFNGGILQMTTSFNLNALRGITLLENGGTIDTGTLAGTYNMTYDGIITGSGPLIKKTTYPAGTQATTVSGTLTLTGANTYTGETIVQTGILVVSNNQALGSTSGGTVVATNGILRLTPGIRITGETLTINGNGNNQGNLQVQGGGAEWAGNIILANNAARIGTGTGGILTISGIIQNGAGTKLNISAQNGTVIFTNVNTYTGYTEMIRGTLQLGIDNALSSSTVLSLLTNNIVTETVAVDLYGYDLTVAGLRHDVVSLVDNLSITNSRQNTETESFESTLTIDQPLNHTYAGKITGNLALIKDGVGTLTLTNTYNSTMASVSTYTGKTTIQGGTLALSGRGNLTGTPWIQVDQGATFSISARTSGDYTLNNQVLSGRGTVNGQLILTGSSYLSPGDSSGLIANAGDGLGELTLNNVTLTGGTPTVRALLELGGTSSNLANNTFAELSLASSGGLYDSIQVNGALALNAGSTIKVTVSDSYVAQEGDVFNLFDWASLVLDGDGANGNAPWTLADLDLSEANAALNTNWYFATDQFLQHGIIYVVIPEPSRVLFLLFGLTILIHRRRR